MNSNVLMQKLVFVASVASQAVLYVLLGLSVLSIGVIVERWWYFRMRRDNLDDLADRLRKAFGRRDLGDNSMGAMGNVMGGIAEALIATAVGILVALPAVIFYNFFFNDAADT